MKICLTANSGGHLNQLLQLKEIYQDHDSFFVTNKTPFSQELAETERVFFAEQFVIKEVFKKRQFLKPLKNLRQSLSIMLREKPDVVITTGAGVSMGMCFLARLASRKLIFIESVARTSSPSTFGKLISKISNKIFVQWEDLLGFYRSGTFSGMVFDFSGKENLFVNKKPESIVVITGTYPLQFNRLLRELDALKQSGEIACNIVAQIGASDYHPREFEFFDYCGQKKLHALIESSDLVICQGGSGSIFDSVLRGKKVIAVPRLPQHDEFFDDHQVELVRKLEKLGLILGLYDDIKNLKSKIQESGSFTPDAFLMKKPQLYRDLADYLGQAQ